MKRRSLTQHMLLGLGFIAAPFLLVVGIMSAGAQIRKSWEAFVSVCIQHINIVSGYFGHMENILPIITAVIFMLGFIGGFLFLARQIKNSRKLHNECKSKIVAAHPVSSHKDRVLVLEDDRVLAFTAGFLKPEIYLSTGLIA